MAAVDGFEIKEAESVSLGGFKAEGVRPPQNMTSLLVCGFG